MPRPAQCRPAHTAHSPEHHTRPRGISPPASPGGTTAASRLGPCRRRHRPRREPHRAHARRASGAIATAATHGAGNTARIAARQTRQVAQQAAAWKGLRSIAQHRRRQRHLTLTVHNATTARDLQPPSQGGLRHRIPDVTPPPRQRQRSAAAAAKRETRRHRDPQGGHGRPAAAPPTRRGGARPLWRPPIPTPRRPGRPREAPLGRAQGVGPGRLSRPTSSTTPPPSGIKLSYSLVLKLSKSGSGVWAPFPLSLDQNLEVWFPQNDTKPPKWP